MILKKEFYFVRHGQTDHNIAEGNHKEDHPEDLPLNETGKSQALSIEPVIASLPIQTVCSSPLKRALQTKEIITPRLAATHHEIEHLGECSARIWKEMFNGERYRSLPVDGHARLFMDRVLVGINHALTLPGPLLVVAHGGVHWALCCLAGIENHAWAIGNCMIVHFSVRADGKGMAQKLTL